MVNKLIISILGIFLFIGEKNFNPISFSLYCLFLLAYWYSEKQKSFYKYELFFLWFSFGFILFSSILIFIEENSELNTKTVYGFCFISSS